MNGVIKEATLESITRLERGLEPIGEMGHSLKVAARKTVSFIAGGDHGMSVMRDRTERKTRLNELQTLFSRLSNFEDGPFDYLTSIGYDFEKHIHRIYGVKIVDNEAIARRIERTESSTVWQVIGSLQVPVTIPVKVRREDILDVNNQDNRDLARLIVEEIRDKMR